MKRLLLILLTACAARGSVATNASSTASSSTSSAVEVELVETAPSETTFDHPDVRDAGPVWTELIDHATKTIELSHFYASEVEGSDPRSRLTPVIAALERAKKRGVRVRFIVDKAFAPKYPATVEHLRAIGLEVRILDSGARFGGVQHAKYMIVDREQSFVGSQNFDWRALEHIQEMGVRVRSPVIAGGLSDVFETDWVLAAEDAPSSSHRTRTHVATLPNATAKTGEAVGFYASPRGWLPDESRWELPRMVSLLDGAKRSVVVQVLLYSTHNRDKSEFTTLDEAVRKAAARGVKIRLLVSHWGANPGSANRKAIESLVQVPNIEVKVLTIPPWSGGEIPFARVAHAKYMVVDAESAWVGTSNWEGDYFLKSRDVSIVTEGGLLGPRLAKVFEDGWASAYAKPLD